MLASSLVQAVNSFIVQIGAKSVVDFGCGDGKILGELLCPIKVGIDRYLPALEECQKNFPNVIVVNCFLQRVYEQRLLLPNSFGLVVGFDILEHLTFFEAQRLMEWAEVVAKKGVVWWGPLERDDIPLFVLPKAPTPEHLHKRRIKREELDERGFDVLIFTNCWDGVTGPKLADGFLAMKEVEK